jgi:hypothetical protein
LNVRGLTDIPDRELHAILHGADDIIGQGGRSLLTNILRGSKSKPVLENGLDESPVYGYFRHLSRDDALARIDWAILNKYLRIEYGAHLPVLVFTDKGWEIAREIRANELLQGILAAVGDGPPYRMQHLKDRDRGMILLLLDKIEETREAKIIPALHAWKESDYKKVRRRINRVIRRLEACEDR